MKKVLILISLSLIISLSSFAQKNKRTSAYMYNKNAQYEKAMNAINEAIEHPKTQEDSKTWLYRGIIYYNIAIDTNKAVMALDPMAAAVSAESFAKSKELDPKGSLDNERTLYLLNLPNIFYQKGSKAYSEADYTSAIENFKQAYNIAKLDDRVDTVAAFYVGMCGVFGENYDVAKEYLKICSDVKYNEPKVYLYYARTMKNTGDTTAAFEKLDLGRSLFPADKALQLEQAQLYLETGQDQKLVASLKESISEDPQNPNLYRVLGQTYENIGDVDNAVASYRKAIEIKPDFGDAIFNLGAIYVNQAAEIYKEANDLPFEETAKYEELKNEADAYLNLALPYLEQSLALNPNDEIVIGALKEAYANLKMNDKLQELMDK